MPAISSLAVLAQATVDPINDVVPIIDVSAGISGSKKIVVNDLIKSVLPAPGTIGGTTPAAGTFTTLTATSTFTATSPVLTTAVLNGTITGTSQATANTASTLVMRDASGNFSAGTVSAALSGNATTATALANSRTFWGQAFTGAANVSGAMTGVTTIAASGVVASSFLQVSGGAGTGTSVGFFDYSGGATRIISVSGDATYGDIKLYGANAGVANAILYATFSNLSATLPGTFSVAGATTLAGLSATTGAFSGAITLSGTAIGNNATRWLGTDGGAGWYVNIPTGQQFAVGINGATGSLIVNSSGALTASGNASVGTSVTGATALLSVGDNNGGNSALRLFGAASQKGWQVGSNITSAHALEFTPATANGGTTFTTPTMVLTPGNVAVTGALSATTTLSITGNSTFTGNILFASNGTVTLGAAATGCKQLFVDYTNTATVGAVTINKASGRVNLAAGGTSFTVTNSLVTAASKIFLNADSAPGNVVAVMLYAVPAAGSFTVNAVPAVTNQTAIDFFVVNAD